MTKTKKKQTEIKVRLVITDFECHPSELTRILHLEPTVMWLRGDSIPKTTMTRKQNGWRLDSPSMLRGTLQEQVDALLDKVAPQVGFFHHLPSGSEIELACVVYVYDAEPVLGLSAKSVTELARLGASIDIDYYDLRNDSGKPKATSANLD